MKIGVMSDTHLGRVSDRLKMIVEQVFRDADMILHAGRHCFTVRCINYLQAMEVTGRAGQHGLVGHVVTCPPRGCSRPAGSPLASSMAGGLPPALRERVCVLNSVSIDCLVFGHSHEACNQVINGELYFNPGFRIRSPGESGGPRAWGFCISVMKFAERLLPLFRRWT